MKKDSNLDVGRVDWCDRMNHVVRPMVECGLALWLLMLAAGCQTQFPQPSGAKDQTTAPSQTFALREGDRLKISFPGSPTLDTEQLIRRDGKITLPLVGEVQAAGMTTEALRQNLINLYAPQLSSKEVNVAVASSTFPFYVTGSVIRPGKYTSDHPITALDAVMEAGGFDYTKANLRAVRVLRHGKDRVDNYTLNLKLVLEGKDTKLFYLQPSDIIYVPERFSWF